MAEEVSPPEALNEDSWGTRRGISMARENRQVINQIIRYLQRPCACSQKSVVSASHSFAKLTNWRDATADP